MLYKSCSGWVRRAAHVVLFAGLFAGLGNFSLRAVNVTLAWDPVPGTGVAGYNVYYGQISRGYSSVAATAATAATVSNLQAGVTYYFAVTTRSTTGLESDYSTEISYTPAAVAVNQRPTLNALANVTINEDAPAQVVDLTGISSGSATENQALIVTAFSGNTALIPNPTLNYTSPNPNGLLTFTPVPNASGSATLTVMVDDGGTTNNTLIRTFTVNVQAVNDPPTLDPISDLDLDSNSGTQTVNLTGIRTGAANETQPLSLQAISSKPDITGVPTVNYTSPNSTASLVFTPVANASGAATITVTVNDGQATNNTVSRSFAVAIAAGTPIVVPVTNAVVAPYTAFRYTFNDPLGNGHAFTATLEPGFPDGAKVVKRKNTRFVIWTPTADYASTTNLITAQIKDETDSTITTNLTMQVIVTDYASAIPGRIAVEAGQSTTLPLYAHCSDGLTNLQFTLPWPTALFTTPTLAVSSPSTLAGTLQTQGTNLLINIRALSGQSVPRIQCYRTAQFPSGVHSALSFHQPGHAFGQRHPAWWQDLLDHEARPG